MGFGGGGGGGDSSTEVRYAPYLESIHVDFLTSLRTDVDMLYHNTPRWQSPYGNHVAIEVEDAFFGTGYTIASFPSLYDMYGKFLAGLDIEVLYSQLYEDTLNAPVINDLIASEGMLLDDEINTNSLPRFQAGMRDINSVMSSSFVIGKSLIEDTRTKAISKFSSELKYRLIPVAQDRWAKHLEWNRNVVMSYAEIMKLYYMSKSDMNDHNYEMAREHLLWPFTVYDYERAAIGALQAATNSKTSQKSSRLGGALSGAASGAMAGAMFGGFGAIVGAMVGGIGGYMQSG